MSTSEAIFLTSLLAVVILIIGNMIFAFVAERKNPPTGEFIDCDGVRLHYRQWGDVTTPCVVLFHGNGAMIHDFASSGLVELLARRNYVLCFDRPGYGHSERPRSRIWTPAAQAALFAKALRRLGVQEPIVIGHSWGTLVAVALGLRGDYPVRGLVLASGYYFPTVRLDVWLMSGPAVPIVGDLLRYTLAPILSLAILPALIRKIFAPRPVPKSFKRAFPISLALRPKQLRAAAEESAFLIPAAAQLQFQYRRIIEPVRLFHGDHDQVIEREQSRRLHKVLPRSVLHSIQDAGHMVHHADPAAIAQAVDSIFAEKSRDVGAIAHGGSLDHGEQRLSLRDASG
jgi:pimeloyl-ACP methyl ester carboxylesterase